MKDAVPTLAPDLIYGALKETAIDMDDPGTAGFNTDFDFGTGHGLIQAVDALPRGVIPQADLELRMTAPGTVLANDLLT